MLQDDVKQELVDTSEQLITTQAQRDRNAMKLEQLAQKQKADGDGPAGNQEGDEEGEMGVLAGHLNRIASLEKEVKRLKQVCAVDMLVPCRCSPLLSAHMHHCYLCLFRFTALNSSQNCLANTDLAWRIACSAISDRLMCTQPIRGSRNAGFDMSSCIAASRAAQQ